MHYRGGRVLNEFDAIIRESDQVPPFMAVHLRGISKLWAFIR